MFKRLSIMLIIAIIAGTCWLAYDTKKHADYLEKVRNEQSIEGSPPPTYTY